MRQSAHVRSMVCIAALDDRAVLEVSGEDRVTFLQGLVSNDVTLVGPGRAVWAALLTPQGKYLADFFVLDGGGRLLLDCAAGQSAIVQQKLTRLRLRARVAVTDVSAAWRVHVAWDGTPEIAGATVAAPDPRLADAGWRVLSPGEIATDADAAAWDRHRLALGLPDGARDLEPDKTVLLEAGFDELNGVSWSKGCYMGQELTARTKYRGLIKRRLVPVALAGVLPVAGTPVLDAGGREVGVLRSGRDGRALATLRLDAFAAELWCGGLAVRVAPPAWMVVPAGVGG